MTTCLLTIRQWLSYKIDRQSFFLFWYWERGESHIITLLLTLILSVAVVCASCLSEWRFTRRGNSAWPTWLLTPAWLLEVPVGLLNRCCSGSCATGHRTLSDAMGMLRSCRGSCSAGIPHSKLRNRVSYKNKAGGDLNCLSSSTSCPKLGSAVTVVFLFFKDFQGWIFNNILGQSI